MGVGHDGGDVLGGAAACSLHLGGPQPSAAVEASDDPQPRPAAAMPMNLAAASTFVYEDAVHRGDDNLLRAMRRRMVTETAKENRQEQRSMSSSEKKGTQAHEDEVDKRRRAMIE